MTVQPAGSIVDGLGVTATQDDGELITALGVTATQDDGELITDALVLLRVVDGDGNVVMRACWSPGLAWDTRLGMLHGALAGENPTRSGPA